MFSDLRSFSPQDHGLIGQPTSFWTFSAICMHTLDRIILEFFLYTFIFLHYGISSRIFINTVSGMLWVSLFNQNKSWDSLCSLHAPMFVLEYLCHLWLKWFWEHYVINKRFYEEALCLLETKINTHCLFFWFNKKNLSIWHFIIQREKFDLLFCFFTFALEFVDAGINCPKVL